jgi:hypothetical protein
VHELFRRSSSSSSPADGCKQARRPTRIHFLRRQSRSCFDTSLEGWTKAASSPTRWRGRVTNCGSGSAGLPVRRDLSPGEARRDPRVPCRDLAVISRRSRRPALAPARPARDRGAPARRAQNIAPTESEPPPPGIGTAPIQTGGASCS